MANKLIVVRDCTVSAPRQPNQAFTTGQEVLPGSPYYYQLLWSGNATDTGVPWPTVPETPPYEAVMVTRPTVDARVPEWDQPTQRWVPIPTPAGGGGGGSAVTTVAGRTGDVTLTQDDVADSATYLRFLPAERSKLGAIAPGATANALDSALRDRSTHTGSQSADTLTDGTTNKAFLATERTKLAGIATGATLNSTDAQLKDRANHTGVQTSVTISDFQEAVEDAVAALFGRSTQTGITFSYNDASGTLSATATGSGGIDAETARDTIGAAMVGVGVVTVTVNDAADTITISSVATQNSTDAALRDRTTHTGTQSLSTTTDDVTSTGRLAMTNAERTKLAGITAAATANATDASLRDRSTHTGSQAESTVTNLTTDLAARLLLKNNAVVPLTANTDTIGTFNVINDGTASSGWPNRFVFGATPVGGGTGGAARMVQYFNEYCEWRGNARQNTVLWRAFVREFAADPAHDMPTPIWEIQNDRDNRVMLHAMYGDGKFAHTGDGTLGGNLAVAGALTVTGSISGSNIGPQFKGVYNAGSEPAGQPNGTLILVRP